MKATIELNINEEDFQFEGDIETDQDITDLLWLVRTELRNIIYNASKSKN